MAKLPGWSDDGVGAVHVASCRRIGLTRRAAACPADPELAARERRAHWRALDQTAREADLAAHIEGDGMAQAAVCEPKPERPMRRRRATRSAAPAGDADHLDVQPNWSDQNHGTSAYGAPAPARFAAAAIAWFCAFCQDSSRTRRRGWG